MSVWRYFELWKFIDLLKTKRLFLSRADKLGDPHEGSITRNQYVTLWRQAVNAASIHDPDVLEILSPEHQAEYRRKLKVRVYVSCWHMNDSESEAMWRLYCGTKEGVAIRTTYEKLAQSVTDPNIYIGVIKYKDFEKEGFPLMQFDPNWPPQHVDFFPFMHKRKAFVHESEVRIIRKFDKPQGKESETGIRIKWDLEEVIEEVYVNPYAQNGYLEVVKAVVQKFASGLENTVQWSRMKSEPLY